MRTTMTDTVIHFPGGGPLKFTDETRNALAGLGYKLTRWGVAFGACDDGDEYATITEVLPETAPLSRQLANDAAFTVCPQAGGGFTIQDRDYAVIGTFKTAADAISELHRRL
jgi:hypothetical protein